jgi:hypothetical protein
MTVVLTLHNKKKLLYYYINLTTWGASTIITVLNKSFR